MTKFQESLVTTLAGLPNQTATIHRLAFLLRSNNVAVASSAAALERAGAVVVFPGSGISAPLYVAIKRGEENK